MMEQQPKEIDQSVQTQAVGITVGRWMLIAFASGYEFLLGIRWTSNGLTLHIGPFGLGAFREAA